MGVGLNLVSTGDDKSLLNFTTATVTGTLNEGKPELKVLAR